MSASAVSVVIPVHNGETFLAEAIDSALGQQPAPLEVIVVDDGSSDRTGEVIAGFGEKVIGARQRNRGPAVARNTGIALASAPLIGFLDADDQWTSEALARQLECLASSPEADVVWGRCERLVMPDAPRLDERYDRPQWILCTGAMLFSRQLLEAVGGFDESFRTGEDMDLMARLRERNASIVQHPHVVHRVRVHAASRFRTDPAAMEQGHYRAVRKALARKREKRAASDAAGD
ncbi:MAG: glycosyltransferase family 2 protein [Sphingomonadales bacterium]